MKENDDPQIHALAAEPEEIRGLLSQSQSQGILGQLEADLYERTLRLNNAERILRELGYERCTSEECNCLSYHRTAMTTKQPEASRLLTDTLIKLKRALDSPGGNAGLTSREQCD